MLQTRILVLEFNGLVSIRVGKVPALLDLLQPNSNKE